MQTWSPAYLLFAHCFRDWYVAPLICSSHLDFVQGCRSVGSWVLSVVLVRIPLLLVLYMQTSPHPLLWCLVLIWVYVHAYNLFMYIWQWCFFSCLCLWIFLICTCGHYIVIFFVYAYFFHSCDVSSSLFINYPIDIYIKTHSMCGIV